MSVKPWECLCPLSCCVSQKRTHWHDLLGRHCPRFGMDKVVAVPLPKPVDMWPDASLENFEYKLSLSFDGERYHTPWLYILGKKQTGVPLVEVELVRSGTHLQAVKAKVRVAMDPAMQRCSMNVCYLSHIQMDTARRFVTKHGFKSHFDMSRSGCHCPQVGW